MRNRSLLLLVLPFLLFAANGWGATYYVNQTGGNDANPGTSPSNAWKTISKVNSITFSAGDSILFNRGNTWNESLRLTDGYPNKSGTSGNPVTFGAYGSGAKPILSGGEYNINITNQDYITIQNLDLQYPSQYSVFINGGDGITIDSCEIGRGSAGYGIWASGNPGVHDLTNGLIISNNIVHSHATYDSGDRGGGAYDGKRINDGTNGARIFNNIVTDWGHGAISAVNWWAAYPTNNNWIYNNTITQTSVMIYGRCFNIDSKDPVATGNRVFNNLCSNTRTVNQLNTNGLIFSYNIINNVDSGYECVALQSYLGYRATNMKIYNNVFANCAGNGLILSGGEADPITGNEITNNIFYNNASSTGWQLYIRNPVNISNNTFKNNLFYKSGVTNLINYYGSISVAQFNNADANGDVISGNINANPLFVSSSDYNLQTGSPAINAGINVGLTEDYAGNPVPQPMGGATDIGAYEYGGGAQITSPPNIVKIPDPPSSIQIY